MQTPSDDDNVSPVGKRHQEIKEKSFVVMLNFVNKCRNDAQTSVERDDQSTTNTEKKLAFPLGENSPSTRAHLVARGLDDSGATDDQLQPKFLIEETRRE